MIQAILLIALGFLAAALIGVLAAPALWHRAYRLSRKRLEQSLPITLPEIEAARDQLRASYAVRLRRLETALASAKSKAAMQLVGNSRLQMQIAALKDQIAETGLQLAERRNATTVLEQTITKRFPELDREITAVKAQLQERSYAIQDLANKLNRRNEELEAAQRDASSYQDELTRLRQVLEKSSAGRSGRLLRRASQWNLDDYRAEYDRLNLELSKLRQQLSQLQEREVQQANVIKEDLQKLAELILASAQPRATAQKVEKLEPAARPASIAGARRERPLPWPEEASRPRAGTALPAALSEAPAQAGEKSEPQGTPPEGLAADFGARGGKPGTESAAKLAPEAGASQQSEARAPRPSLREPVQGEGAGEGAPNAGAQEPAGGGAGAKAAPAAAASINGSGKGAEANSEPGGDILQSAEKPASAAGERNGAQPGGTLLERLRKTSTPAAD